MIDTDVFAPPGPGGTLPTNASELLTNNTLGGEVIHEHQTRPARIIRGDELI